MDVNLWDLKLFPAAMETETGSSGSVRVEEEIRRFHARGDAGGHAALVFPPGCHPRVRARVRREAGRVRYGGRLKVFSVGRGRRRRTVVAWAAAVRTLWGTDAADADDEGEDDTSEDEDGDDAMDRLADALEAGARIVEAAALPRSTPPPPRRRTRDRSRTPPPSRRPQTSTLVARRMLGGALGLDLLEGEAGDLEMAKLQRVRRSQSGREKKICWKNRE